MDAQAWINTLFGGRQRAWSSDELQKLKKLLPILPEHRALLSWAYTLPRDSEGWAIIDGERASKPKQSCLLLLEQFSSEIDKWTGVRAYLSGSGEYDEVQSDGWTPERLEIRGEILPNETDWPERFDQLPVDVQRRFNQVVKQRTAAKQMNETTITAQ